MISSSLIRSKHGHALVTVVLFTALLLAISAALLSWSTTEVKIGSSHKRLMSARNMAEAVLEYGAAQAALQLQQITDFDTTMFDPSDTANAIPLPPTSFFTGTNIDSAKLEVVAQVVPPPPTGRFDVNLADPRNSYTSLRNSGRKGTLKIIARATSLPDVYGHTETFYLKKQLTILDGPVLQYAAFYNMDFEVAPGPDLNVYGPVHTNGDMWLSKQSSGGDLTFWDKVTASGKLHKGFKVEPYQSDGSREASKDGHINFITTSGTLVNLRGDWGNWRDVWRDQFMGTDTDQSIEFEKFTNQTYGDPETNPITPSNLQTIANSIKRRPLPGQLDNYVPDPNPTDKTIDPVFRNVPRALIERPLNPGDAEYVGNEVEKQKMSRKAGLYIAVNATDSPLPAARVKDPSGAVISGGFAAREYRAWMKNPETRAWVEVRLPGQPDFGTHQGHTTTAGKARPIIQVSINKMVDLRRYNERSDTSPSGYDFFQARGTNNIYKPKTINIIDVDMTALKKAVERSVNLHPTGKIMIFPYDSETSTDNNWTSTYRAAISEYGVNGTKTGLYTLTDADLIEGMPDRSYWDGSVYIESIEADFLSTGVTSTSSPAPTPLGSYPIRRNYGHRMSGVRLINGRGPILTADANRLADTAHPCGPGLTLSTNDALYILGHLNADGAINPTTLPASNPLTSQLSNVATTDSPTSGNNSSLFPDPPIRSSAPTEQPLALVADAVTILSQPIYDNSGKQIGGWADPLSYLAYSATNWDAAWMSTALAVGSTNRKDGEIEASAVTGAHPERETPFDPMPADFIPSKDDPSKWDTVKTFRTTKFPASPTEISAGFIIGLTPSAKHPTNSAKDGQNSGGLHNLPRFLESWKDPTDSSKSTTCAIRGSMVVMFESQVAWEPWSLRVYEPPGRFWGFHNFFRNFVFSDDIPATRNFGVTSGDTYQRLTGAAYKAERAAMWPSYSFPTIP